MEYIPVAVRTQILFFCVSDLANVDPMYQYSLEWFLNIFLSGIANSERAGSPGTDAHVDTNTRLYPGTGVTHLDAFPQRAHTRRLTPTSTHTHPRQTYTT